MRIFFWRRKRIKIKKGIIEGNLYHPNAIIIFKKDCLVQGNIEAHRVICNFLEVKGFIDVKDLFFCKKSAVCLKFLSAKTITVTENLYVELFINADENIEIGGNITSNKASITAYFIKAGESIMAGSWVISETDVIAGRDIIAIEKIAGKNILFGINSEFKNPVIRCEGKIIGKVNSDPLIKSI